MLYLLPSSANESACSGTFEPLVVTRCRGMEGPASSSSSSSSWCKSSASRSLSSSSSSLLFLLGIPSSLPFAALRLLELGPPPWAYLKKFSSEGSSPEFDSVGFLAFSSCDLPFGYGMWRKKYSDILSYRIRPIEKPMRTLKSLTSLLNRFLSKMTPPRESSWKASIKGFYLRL
jgi:hypothetical protein